MAKREQAKAEAAEKVAEVKKDRVAVFGHNQFPERAPVINLISRLDPDKVIVVTSPNDRFGKFVKETAEANGVECETLTREFKRGKGDAPWGHQCRPGRNFRQSLRGMSKRYYFTLAGKRAPSSLSEGGTVWVLVHPVGLERPKPNFPEPGAADEAKGEVMAPIRGVPIPDECFVFGDDLLCDRCGAEADRDALRWIEPEEVCLCKDCPEYDCCTPGCGNEVLNDGDLCVACYFREEDEQDEQDEEDPF